MVKTEIHFEEAEHSKLDRAVFPTIRRSAKYGNTDHLLKVTAGEQQKTLGCAKVVRIEETTLASVPVSFLKYNTDELTFDTAVRSIRNHWPDEIESDETLFIYWLAWTARGE